MGQRTVGAIMLAALLMTACSGPAGVGSAAGAVAGSPLAGTSWDLQALGEETVPRMPAVTLNFALDGQISGNDGCNQYQGSYTIEVGSITMARNLMGTLIACPDPIDARARAYLWALREAAHFTIDGSTLSLQDVAGRRLATFMPAITSPADVDWEVIAYNNGQQGVVSVLSGARVSASFGNDGRVTGSAGCNQYFAAYKLDGHAIRIGVAATTRKYCPEPEGLMEQEGLYLEALKSSSSFRLNGDRLELRTADGATAVTLHRSAGE